MSNTAYEPQQFINDLNECLGYVIKSGSTQDVIALACYMKGCSVEYTAEKIRRTCS